MLFQKQFPVCCILATIVIAYIKMIVLLCLIVYMVWRQVVGGGWKKENGNFMEIAVSFILKLKNGLFLVTVLTLPNSYSKTFILFFQIIFLSTYQPCWRIQISTNVMSFGEKKYFKISENVFTFTIHMIIVWLNTEHNNFAKYNIFPTNPCLIEVGGLLKRRKFDRTKDIDFYWFLLIFWYKDWFLFKSW